MADSPYATLAGVLEADVANLKRARVDHDSAWRRIWLPGNGRVLGAGSAGLRAQEDQQNARARDRQAKKPKAVRATFERYRAVGQGVRHREASPGP